MKKLSSFLALLIMLCSFGFSGCKKDYSYYASWADVSISLNEQKNIHYYSSRFYSFDYAPVPQKDITVDIVKSTLNSTPPGFITMTVAFQSKVPLRIFDFSLSLREENGSYCYETDDTEFTIFTFNEVSFKSIKLEDNRLVLQFYLPPVNSYDNYSRAAILFQAIWSEPNEKDPYWAQNNYNIFGQVYCIPIIIEEEKA